MKGSKWNMKRVLFISLYEPCKYGGRAGGPVILLNDILESTEQDIEVDLLIYKKDEIVAELKKNINFIPWSSLTKKIKNKSLYEMIPKSMGKDFSCYEIDLIGYEKVILYPYFSSLFKFKNCKAEIYTIGMDSGPMLYLRGIINHKRLLSKIFCMYMFGQAIHIDKKAARISKKVFTVGKSDAEFYRSVYIVDAEFISHPVTKLIDNYTPIKWEQGSKLKICFPGGNSQFYTYGLVEGIINLLQENSNKYKDKVEISILGKIGYRELEQALRKAKEVGFTINYEEYVEDFEKYLSMHHIILLPLLVGAGTKNKALSSLGMGLDFIGTPIAIENVNLIKKEHIAKSPHEFLEQIDVRLNNHKLFGLSKDEIIKFKEYHSVNNWFTFFWEEVMEDN